MKSSPNGKIFSILKRHSIITIIITAILTLMGIIIALCLEHLPKCWEYITSWFLTYPLFAGAIFSWIFAVLATGIVLLLAHINRGKKDQYENVLEKCKKWLIWISLGVIFYISINLASEAITEKGIPKFSESYKIGPFTNVAYQDIFLIFLFFTIIFLVFLVAPYSFKKGKRIFVFGVIMVVLLVIPLFAFSFYKEDIPETNSFSWSSVPGDNDEKFRKFLKDDFNISWAENAEFRKSNDCMTISIIQDKRSSEIMMDETMEKAILKISDGRIHELKVKRENGKLNIYYSETTQKEKSEQILPFFVLLVVSSLIAFLLWFRMPKEAKDDNLRDLFFYFSILPALVVASLVLIEHNLVTYPNFTGHVVVGFLFISGFATLVILTMISLKDVKNGWWMWGFTVSASLAAISGFSCGFLLLEHHIHEIGTFRKFITFSIVIILIILQYSFAYEKLMKYRFTEWWRRTMKPIAMIIAISMILIVSALNPEHEFKLFWIFIALIFVLFLPWIVGLCRFWKYRKRRIFTLRLPNLRYLFIWNNFPVNDSKRLQKYLKDDCKIDWAEKAEICKSYDGKTIRLSKDEKSAQITIDEEEKKVTLKIGDGEPFDLDGEMKNGRLMIRRHIPKKPLRFTLPKFMLPKYQAMVLVKAKTDPGKLKDVINGLDCMEGEGVYQTMVVRGEYDVCLIVEGVSSDDIEKKILKIRKIDGVAGTTTLRDIREFFDREVK